VVLLFYFQGRFFKVLNKFSFAKYGRVAITSIAVLIAACVFYRLWIHYEVEPWTRDGRVKANVILIAPDVSGLVTHVYVKDNMRVKAGEVLFDIDTTRFTLAVQQAKAAENVQRASYQQAMRDVQRNLKLHNAVPQMVTEESQSRLAQLRAALNQAIAARELAELNLERTKVTSPVNGVVTNLDLQAGAHATSAQPVMALIDRDSFYVEGYFEESKLPHIQVDDPVTVQLMGQDTPLHGIVESFSEGIADRDRSVSSNLLSNINPTFNWVRLAQRIPVRIKLDQVPNDIRLIAGQTATVIVHPANTL
jgi:multidrug resistance efflux pump